MTLFAFTSAHPLKAAAELREAGYDAFCLMMMDRRKASRSVRKSTASVQKPIVALQGYCFAHMAEPDAWKISQMKHIRNAVKNAQGRWMPIPAREAAWLESPPRPLFHDTNIPRYVNRPAPPMVKAGDVVRFTLAAEQHTLPVDSVDGEILVMRINLLGREIRTRVPVHMVEVAA